MNGNLNLDITIESKDQAFEILKKILADFGKNINKLELNFEE